MALSLITNIGSLIASNGLTQNQNGLNQSIAQLSSGKRIVSSANDPAGLAIASQTAGTLSGLTQASANDANAQSFLQTADGALANINNVLTTLQQVATEAADGSFSSSQLADLQTQYASLYSQIDSIAQSAQFNGIALLSGGSKTFQVGSANTGAQQQSVALPTISAASLLSSTTPVSGTALVAGTNVSIAAPVGVAAHVALGGTAASSSGLANQAAATATNDKLSSNAPSSLTLTVVSINNGAATSGALGTDNITFQVADSTGGGGQVTLYGAAAQLAITNVDNLGFDLKVGNAADTFKVGDQISLNFGTAGGVSNVSTQAAAQTAIGAVQTAIQTVATDRASIGASLGQLATTATNLSTYSQNLTQALSTIQDANVAQTFAQFTKESVLQQAGVQVLRQADAAPQQLLALFQ
ncbi:MAG TPA: flagellin [Candidatus Binataceae bacterium]|nr:flagellin [Candidatus Binataceae bacterium]